MTLCDTHCHLNLNSFDHDLDLVLQRASYANVTKILVPGIDIPTSQSAIQLAEKYPQVYAAVGIHPNSGNSWDTSSQDAIKQMAKHPKVVAIGEIGLDHYRTHTEHDLQKKIFLAQLNLAADTGKPVILHSRNAESEILKHLRSLQKDLQSTRSSPSVPNGVFHSFGGNMSEAEEAIALGFYIGVAGPVTFLNARQLHQTISALPLTSLLLETDAPFMSPHPLRGRRNEPVNIPLIVQKIAELHTKSIMEISSITTNNAEILFHW